MTRSTQLLKDLQRELLDLNSKDWDTLGFNMGYWARYKRPTSPQLGCGTNCCAYGLGTTLPSWQEAGLRLVYRSHHLTQEYVPSIGSANILGLSPQEWAFIFVYGGEDICSPGEVAARIASVLEGAFDEPTLLRALEA